MTNLHKSHAIKRYQRLSLMSIILFAGMFAALLWLTIVPRLGQARPQQVATVWLDTPDPMLAVGNTLTLTVRVSNVVDLYGAHLVLGFPAGAIAILDADPSAAGIQIAPADCPAPDFVARNIAINDTGISTYVVTQLNPTLPVTGNCAVARISVQGLQEGIVHITFDELILLTPSAEPITVTTQAITLTVDGTPPVSAATGSPAETSRILINVSWVATDVLSGVAITELWVRFNGDEWVSTELTQTGIAGVFTFTPTSGSGSYAFAVQSTDQVGHQETTPTGDGDTITIFTEQYTVWLPLIQR